MKRESRLEDIRAYWNLRAKGYSMDNNEELQEKQREVWLSRITEFAPRENFSRVLDIGCGPGFFSILLAQAGYDVKAIDYTDNMIREAEANALSHGVKVDIQRMDAQQLNFENDYFDLIVTRNLTWNLEYPELAYGEWIRALRPGGKLINSDGNYYHYVQDEAYRLQSGDGHKHLEGIDVSVINNIGERLPLAKQLRPAWDERTLFSLGVRDVRTEIVRSERVEYGGVTRELINNFIVYAVK
jgi:SAM-dependent methyltransferase